MEKVDELETLQTGGSPAIVTEESNAKHSSGDLHSRLKTRKLLGVGETDDGDVHRSKLSQILGHSEQLYVRIPKGLRIWQFLVALTFTGMALWAILCPKHLFTFVLQQEAGDATVLPTRLYGAALLSFAMIYWSAMQATDREVIRWALLSSATYFIIQIIVSFGSLLSASGLLITLCSLGCVGLTLYFYWLMGKHYSKDWSKGS